MDLYSEGFGFWATIARCVGDLVRFVLQTEYDFFFRLQIQTKNEYKILQYAAQQGVLTLI